MFKLIALFLPVVASSEVGSVLWSQEFNQEGFLDESVWNYDLGASGWGNQELQEYVADAASVEGGALKITATKEVTTQTRGKKTIEDISFKSARLTTMGKFSFQYGTVEAMVSFPDLMDGLWPAVWFLGDNFPTIGWPNCGELDLLEMGSAGAISAGVVNRRVGSTAHWEFENGYAGYGEHVDVPADLNDGQYHNFTMTWTPDMIETYVDGQWIWAFDISNPLSFDGEEFHQPFFILVNLAVGGTYTGLFGEEDITAPFPAVMSIDSIKVFRNAYTLEPSTPVPSPPTAAPVSSPECSPQGSVCVVGQDCCSGNCKGRVGRMTCK